MLHCKRIEFSVFVIYNYIIFYSEMYLTQYDLDDFQKYKKIQKKSFIF